MRALLAGLASLGMVAAAGAADRPAPGAYCPLPEKGEVPQCLSPAKDTYGAFFSALDEGGEQGFDDVEQAVARGASEEQAYLALSSLTYGYYRLAQRAAAEEDVDPEIAARLSRWNDLLARAFEESPDDEPYRQAVRQAAQELSERAPVRVPCRDARGEESDCTSTENVLRGFNAASDEVGIRGALDRLMRRLFGDGDA
ncbi:MAG: hypothetical protein ACQGVC_02155 [Myxococcota bacterium]